MDAFELIRRRAQSRRAALAGGEAAGLEVARAAAVEVGVELVPLAPDDVLLSGAEAVLDRGLAAIFYNATASEATAAALVAHELGHLELHTGAARCAAADVDAAVSEEPTPAGLARLESYGARERQELQANVYARELLLPRRQARSLYLEQGLGAAHIAERRCLPLDVVRQQLCDGVLLPLPEDPEEPEEPDSGAAGLDPSQRAAAEHTGSPLLLEAGPGTGKTRTLVARIVHLVEGGTEAASILALTFSNKAAREITERVAASLPEAAPHVWTGTFHAFGLELLRQHHELLGLEPDIRVLDRSDAIALLEDLLPTLGLVHHQNLYDPALELKEILAAIGRAKDELTCEEPYAALAQAMLVAAGDDEKRRSAAEKALEVAKVYGVYQRTLRARKAVDFGDLILLPTRLLAARPALRDALRLRHRHVLVDEYQDVNRASAGLLKELAGDGRRLWVVGDSRQSIYRFRGASATNMALFCEDFPGAERRALAVNYRSSEEVVATFSRFARRMAVSGVRAPERQLELRLAAHRGRGGSAPDACVLDDPETEISAVAARLLLLRQAGVPLAEQAVLCRSNARLSQLSRGLERREVPVLHLGSLFERDEVRDMLALLALVVDRRGGGLMRVAAFSDYAVPLADAQRFLAAVRDLEIAALEGLRRLGEIEGLSAAGRAGLERLASDLEGVERTAMPWSLLTRYLFDRAAYLRRLLAPQAAGGVSPGRAEAMRGIALYQLLSFVRQARPGGRGLPGRRLLEKVRRLVLLGEERDLRQIPATALHYDAVRLLTIHGSKGLEFEAVHLPALTAGGLPASFRARRCPPPAGLVELPEGAGGESGEAERELHAMEEECLFFVALSRARTHLHLYRARTAGARNRSPSKFLGLLRPGLVERVLPGSAGFAGADDDGGVVRLVGPPPEVVAAGDLSEYERCPRRYFYGRVFGLAGSRRDGAFVRTHRAIYRLIDQLRGAAEPPDRERAMRQLDQAWRESGPVGHAFERQYRRLAEGIVGNLVEANAALELIAADPLILELPHGNVSLQPELTSQGRGGGTGLRLVRTGRKGSFSGDGLVHGLFEAAARQRYGWDGYRLEVLHLSDRELTPIDLSEAKIRTRLEKGDRFLAAMAEGRFPTRRDPAQCPRCPYFFVCPALPPGELPWRRV